MPGPGTPAPIFCPAGRFTQVTYGSAASFRYRYTALGANVKWRRFAIGLPPYWEGYFYEQGDFLFLAWPYFSFELNPNIDSLVTIALL